MRATFLFVMLTFLAALGCNGASHLLGNEKSCEPCHAGCSNGIATVCLVLTPPGCGAQASQQFCPNGCSSDAPGGCNHSPVDGAAPSGCVASDATITQGALEGAGQGADHAVAVTTFLPAETRVVVATSAAAACAATKGAGGAAPSGDGAALTLSLPPSFAGTVAVSTGARLSVWKAGAIVIDNQPATAGGVTLNLQQPGGGTMGSYEITFAGGDERGTFVAPACDICAQ